MADEHWPGGIAAYRLAGIAIDEIRAEAKRRARRKKEFTRGEADAIMENAIARWPGCAAGIVRELVESWHAKRAASAPRRTDAVSA